MPSSIVSPFPVFNDLDGTPLENGYIYIGQSNLNPETAPVNVFWDAARTIPAAQPIRTIGGFPSRNGSPSNIYVENDTYSITVRNSRRAFVYSAFDQTDAPSSVFDISTQVITATAGQLTFTLTVFTYLPGTDTLQVYRNGLRLNSGTDYLESNSSTVTLTSPAAAGDEFLFQGGAVITGGNIPGSGVSFIQAGTGAVPRNMQDKVRESVSVKDFGAVGDGVADDTVAIQTAITQNPGKSIFIPAGIYKISSTISIQSSNTALFGESSHNTTIIGNFSSGNLIHVGKTVPTEQIFGISISGIKVDSSVLKTNGAAFYFTQVVRSTIRDVIAAGQDKAQINNFLWDGFVFSGLDLITLSEFQSCVQNKGITISAFPSSGQLGGDMFIEQGRVQFCSLGMHIAGGMGGVSVCQIDILDNDSSLLIDSAIYTAQTNRDAWFGPNCYFDSTTSNNIVINNGSCNQISFANTSIATCVGTNILVNSLQGNLILDSVLIADATVDGIRINDPNCAVSMFGCILQNNAQYGYNQNVTPSNYGDINIGGNVFKLNGSGETRNVSTVKTVAAQNSAQFSAIGASANINLEATPKGSGAFVVSSSGNGPMFYVLSPGTGGTYTNIPTVKPSISVGNVVFGATSSGNSGVDFQTAGTGSFFWSTNAITRATLDGTSGNFQPYTDNAYTLGGPGNRWSSVWAANGTIQTSDARQKTDIADASLGLNFINALRPVSYKWIEGSKEVVRQVFRDAQGNECEATADGAIPSEIITKSIPGQRTHWGLLAQEVKAVCDAAGVDFGGWVLTEKDNQDSQQALRYDQFIAPLIKAVQELSKRVAELESK